tara:strand:- start:2916 stop:3137 length:222 start_codon:yes stop_codon:yes gene_type:complete
MSIIEEGQLKGTFKGFKNRDTIFEFNAGRKWKQNEYKYNYHYAYMPQAKVVSENTGDYLIVEGMSDKVLVKRA